MEDRDYWTIHDLPLGWLLFDILLVLVTVTASTFVMLFRGEWVPMDRVMGDLYHFLELGQWPEK